ncbi:MAG: signal peptidase II [Acidimicrobiales bacterium]
MRVVQGGGPRLASLSAIRLARKGLAIRAGMGALAGAVVVADQVTKAWAIHHLTAPRHILGPLWFTLTFNSGAAFGLGSGDSAFVVVIDVVLVVGLLAFVLASRPSRTAAVGLGLLLGGAAANLVGRFFGPSRGTAGVDFIDAVRVGTHDYWPVFNVADMAIVIGLALVLLEQVTKPVRRPARRPAGSRT